MRSLASQWFCVACCQTIGSSNFGECFQLWSNPKVPKPGKRANVLEDACCQSLYFGPPRTGPARSPCEFHISTTILTYSAHSEHCVAPPAQVAAITCSLQLAFDVIGRRPRVMESRCYKKLEIWLCQRFYSFCVTSQEVTEHAPYFLGH